MTKTAWLKTVNDNVDDLRNLVGKYHPSVKARAPLPITAPMAEAACAVVREQISKTTTRPALERFDQAVNEEDTKTLHNLFSDTWFGVPESTSCWSLCGFSVLVDLLDDPID